MHKDRRTAPGVWTDGPLPDDYPHYRPLLGTREGLACTGRRGFSGPLCSGAATRVWCVGLVPAQPLCEGCYQWNARYGDAACACLARRDETGIWRPTDQGGDFQANAYDFDW